MNCMSIIRWATNSYCIHLCKVRTQGNQFCFKMCSANYLVLSYVYLRNVCALSLSLSLDIFSGSNGLLFIYYMKMFALLCRQH